MYTDDIKLLASGLPAGHSQRVVCPVCHKKTMSITASPSGDILYNCFRVSCVSGKIVGAGGPIQSAYWENPVSKVVDPYQGNIVALDEPNIKFFSERYELEPKNMHIGTGAGNRYILPIFGADMNLKGHLLRAPWKDSPLYNEVGEVFPKAITKMAVDAPKTAFYFPDFRTWREKVVLVEDQLSAMKLKQEGFIGVSVNGSPPQSIEAVREIQRATFGKPLLIALDADATRIAFDWARDWGQAFNTPRVVILDRDLKDTPKDDILHVLS